mgnify:CR=1 FL=1
MYFTPPVKEGIGLLSVGLLSVHLPLIAKQVFCYIIKLSFYQLLDFKIVYTTLFNFIKGGGGVMSNESVIDSFNS